MHAGNAAGAAGIGDLDTLCRMMAAHGVRELVVKELSANDNSKNQVYLGGSFDILNVLPVGTVTGEADAGGGTGHLRASLPLDWLRADGTVSPAPGAQLVLYPQYPEVRLSGFLKGASGAPNDLMTQRQPGRLLFLGVTNDRRTIGWVASHDSPLATQVRALPVTGKGGVFTRIQMAAAGLARDRLLDRLRTLAAAGWCASTRLSAGGIARPCIGTNCGGYTLEAHFGIVPNGKAEPDFEGWEIKAHGAGVGWKPAGAVTLMTPEPTGGFYKEAGCEAFVRKFGYPDKKNIPDRLNFSSPHRHPGVNATTGLRLGFSGYDPATHKITNAAGGFSLLDSTGAEAATWHFAGLLQHWNKKHANAAYVPCKVRKLPSQQYAYGQSVRLAEGTDFLRFLRQLADGTISYDPGIKLTGASTSKSRVKARSQFRINAFGITSLYSAVETVVL